ncbi:MAG: hypothetical protein FWF72_06750 [Paludibacter sp.]|nr:hypothetical protein [Paludibacter sp.]
MPKIKQAAKDITDYIRAYIGKDIVDMMSERDFKALINRLESATSIGSLKEGIKAVNQSVMKIILRKNKEILNGLIHGKILNTHAIYELDAAIKASNALSEDSKDTLDKNVFGLLSGLNAYNRYFAIQGKNKRGVSVAKNVDEGTREIIQYMRDNYNTSREKLQAFANEINEQMGEKNYKYKEGDARKLIAIELLNRYTDIRDVESDIKALRNQDIIEFNIENPDKWKWEAILERQHDLEKLQMWLIGELTDLIELGMCNLAEWKEREIAHNMEIAAEAIAAVTDKPVKTQGEEKKMPTVKPSLLKRWYLSAYKSFEFMLSYIDRNHPTGEGAMYRRWMPLLTKASDQMWNGYNEYAATVNSAAKSIFGESFEKVLSDSRTYSGCSLTYMLYPEESGADDGEMHTETIPMTKGELMYVWLTWQHADGREKLEGRYDAEKERFVNGMGITQEDIDSIEKTLGEKYIRFGRWIQDEFLTDTREKYNKTHIDVFGTSMGKVAHYFPLKYADKDLTPKADIDDISPALPSTMTGAIINRVKTTKHIKLDANFIDILMEHGRDMESWNAYAKLRKDLNALLKNREFRNRMEANSAGSFEAFESAARIAVDANQKEPTDAEQTFINTVRKLQGAAIAGRINTAFKQGAAVLSYPFYAVNAKYYEKLINNLLNPIKFKDSITWAKNNLPTYAERLGQGVFGNEKLLTEEWEDSLQAAGKRGFGARIDNKIIEKTGKETRAFGKAGRAIDKGSQWLTTKGMLPNKWMDGWFFACGSRAIYEYEYEKNLGIGMSEQAARERALFDAANYSNKVSQSANPAYLSELQKSKTWWAVSMSAFMNANFGFGRNVTEGALQLKRAGRQILTLTAENTTKGMSEAEAKKAAQKEVLNANGKAVLKLIYSGFIANVAFEMFDMVLSSLISGGYDDDDEKERQLLNAAWHSPLNNVLGGNLLVSAFDGYAPQSLMDSEISRAVSELKKATKDGFDEEMAYAAMQYSLKFGLGLNTKTVLNVYEGIERGIIEKGGAAMAWQYFTNVPQSVRIATTKKLREGESITDYAKRVKLAYDSQSRAEKEMKEIVSKYIGADSDGNITKFNRIASDAQEWKKLDKKGKENLNIFQRAKYEKLKENAKAYEDFLRFKSTGALSTLTKAVKSEDKEHLDILLKNAHNEYNRILNEINRGTKGRRDER